MVFKFHILFLVMTWTDLKHDLLLTPQSLGLVSVSIRAALGHDLVLV